MKKKLGVLRFLLYLPVFFLGRNQLAAQQSGVDSATLSRINTLEQEVADQKPGESHFMVAGLATMGFVSNSTNTVTGGIGQKVKTNSMADADHYEFSPMLLWRHGKNLLLEFEPSFDGYGLGVNWADVSYFAAPGLIVRAGYFVLPFGTYNKRLAAGWIDKVAGDPVGLADLPPSSDFGVEIEGGLPMGNMKWNYDVSVTNGMQMQSDGELQGIGVVDNNKNKTITARVGWLPFQNSCLEIGLSGMFGKVGDAGTEWENVKTDMYAADLNFVKTLNPFLVNIKGQYNYIHVGDAQFANPDDMSAYTFKNTTKTGFAQISLRPTGSNGNFVKNLEFAFRYGNFTTPGASLWAAKTNSWDFGLDYWLSWRTVLKFTYENMKTDNTVPASLNTAKSNSLFLQFSTEF